MFDFYTIKIGCPVSILTNDNKVILEKQFRVGLEEILVVEQQLDENEYIDVINTILPGGKFF